ncbi:MAG: hypothetical protein LBT09_14925, partial [Planctomycetaceae bacterium]|nr:hypothetical protein [Planctomycetaceae bacterium]
MRAAFLLVILVNVQKKERRSMFQRFFCAICLLVILTAAGCGSGDGMVKISGSVTLDGVPLETGNMMITAADSPVSGCEVK